MIRERVESTKRRAMTKARRLAVFTASNGYCAVCGSETPLEEGEADHELSLFLGGGVFGTFLGATMSDKFGRKTIIAGSMVVVLPMVAALSLFRSTHATPARRG